jgi:hypothetical protein
VAVACTCVCPLDDVAGAGEVGGEVRKVVEDARSGSEEGFGSDLCGAVGKVEGEGGGKVGVVAPVAAICEVVFGGKVVGFVGEGCKGVGC